MSNETRNKTTANEQTSKFSRIETSKIAFSFLISCNYSLRRVSQSEYHELMTHDAQTIFEWERMK